MSKVPGEWLYVSENSVNNNTINYSEVGMSKTLEMYEKVLEIEKIVQESYFDTRDIKTRDSLGLTNTMFIDLKSLITQNQDGELEFLKELNDTGATL